MLTLSFTEGGAVMVAELIGAKMLAPLYGSSLYVWGSVIGITLISLTSGYYLGGLLSYRENRREILLWSLLVAALMITVMPWIADTLMLSFDHLDVVQSILGLTAVYLLPPLVLLGAVSPLIISVISSEVADAGKAAGTVYAVSTVGGILTTFLCGFYLIPRFGLTNTALVAGAALAILPVVLLLKVRHYPALVYPVLLLALLIPAEEKEDYPVEILYHSEGLLGQLMVVDVPFRNRQANTTRTDRLLFVNRMAQTWVNLNTGQPAWDYVSYLQSVASVLPQDSRVLVLGLGGGLLARELQRTGMTVDGVELDGRIAQVAKEYFGLQEKGEIIVDDGRHYLRSTSRTYDLIIFDVFKAEVPPAHMLTVETFKGVRDLLNPGGFMVVNYNGFLKGSVGYGGRSIFKTLRAAGYNVHVMPTRGPERGRNTMYIATLDAVDFGSPRVPLVIGGRPRPLPSQFIDPESIDVEDAMVLRDNRPILEKLNLEAAAMWREDYTNIFTKRFAEMGVPLFE